MSGGQLVEVADVFRSVLRAGKLKASPSQWKIINAITRCRTSQMGGHLYQCSSCGHTQPQYNSCRNRHCPKCQGAKIHKWLQDRESELLEVPYFHTVFTVPHELNILFLQNKSLMFNLLFQAVAKTLKQATSSRYGGEVGFFAILHTWGQKMEFHPHIHCVIPGVVLKKNGQIKQTPNNYFIPDRILSKIFRGIFLKLLGDRYTKLSLYGNAESLNNSANFQKLKNKTTTKSWVLYSKKPFAGPSSVLKYLSRYTHRVAISNQRIRSLKDGTVSFSYKDYSKKRKRKICRLNQIEFARRFLLHSLPHQFVRIRHFGFMANIKRKAALLNIQQQLRHKPTGSPSTKSLPIKCPSCKIGLWLKKMPLHNQLQSLNPIFLCAIIPHRTKPPPANLALGG